MLLLFVEEVTQGVAVVSMRCDALCAGAGACTAAGGSAREGWQAASRMLRANTGQGWQRAVRAMEIGAVLNRCIVALLENGSRTSIAMQGCSGAETADMVDGSDPAHLYQRHIGTIGAAMGKERLRCCVGRVCVRGHSCQP